MSVDEYPLVTDDGLIDASDDYELEPEIPTSYLEDGIRHIIVRDGDVELNYIYNRKTQKMEVLTDVF